MTILPHGGRLIDRVATGAARERWQERAPSLPALRLNERELADVELLAVGACSPLEGFLTAADYRSVRDTMRLADGTAWPMPITLSIPAARKAEFAAGTAARLESPDGDLVAVIEIEEVYPWDPEREAELVFRTTDAKHPGVAYLRTMGELLVGGKVTLLNRPARDPLFEQCRLDPRETRMLFREKGWKRVVAFQTRNPVHRAHEYLQKCALEACDALLLHPLVGATKDDDIPAEVRMRCYRVLLENWYPADRTVLSVFPAAMRYAGPREAVFHALCRKNYGCTHFIVGRDHAGVGNYYGTYDAQLIFDEFEPAELGIIPLRFEHTFWCRKCAAVASTKTCPHGAADRVVFSGTAVRELLRRGEAPPPEFTRPEVAAILIAAMRDRK